MSVKKIKARKLFKSTNRSVKSTLKKLKNDKETKKNVDYV